MFYCRVCSEPFHGFCLDEEPIDETTWCCDNCSSCSVCGYQDKVTIKWTDSPYVLLWMYIYLYVNTKNLILNQDNIWWLISYCSLHSSLWGDVLMFARRIIALIAGGVLIGEQELNMVYVDQNSWMGLITGLKQKISFHIFFNDYLAFNHFLESLSFFFLLNHSLMFCFSSWCATVVSVDIMLNA